MILFLKGYAAGLFKMFCKDKNGIFTSTQILKSFYALGHSILDIFKVKHYGQRTTIFRILKINIDKKKLTIMLNLRYFSFIGNRSLFFITQY